MSSESKKTATVKMSEHEKSMARLRAKLSVLQSPEGFQLSVDVGVLTTRVRLAVLDKTREERIESKALDKLASAPTPDPTPDPRARGDGKPAPDMSAPIGT